MPWGAGTPCETPVCHMAAHDPDPYRRSMSKSTASSLIAAGTASALLLLSACGSDDSGNAGREACDAWIAADASVIGYVFMDQGEATSVMAALDTAVATAPDDIVDTMTALRDGARPMIENPGDEPSEEVFQRYRETVEWAGERCDVETLEVIATDFAYAGIPDELSTGYHVVSFANEGQEQHEMFVFRINDGVAETLDEIFETPEEEIFDKITPVNAAFALPEATDTASWNLASEGRYAAVCFIPVGSVGENEGDGPPHFTEGMVHEFTVTS
jgi:hypothetical protein